MATAVERAEPPLVVIVGPTASGKTALAIRLARYYLGEVICADSRTVYRGMDIGTAKPALQEQAGVPHWGIDLVDPGQRFTAAEFKQYARCKICEIRARGHVPIVVGGTGLYVDGLLFDYDFGGSYDQMRRGQLESLELEELYRYCQNNNIPLPENKQNRRHIVRAIEQKSISPKRRAMPIENTIVVGIATDNDVLRIRMKVRSEQILANGVVNEAIRLGKKYGWESEAMTGNIYPLIRSYLEGRITVQEIEDKNTTSDWQLAKRQMTWFRRNPYIYWGEAEQIYRYVASVLDPGV